MTREIKFRGKRLDNGEWVYGYLFKIWERCFILWGTTNDIPNMVEVIPETVGQFTGLKGENDKEIFEGDIIEFSVFDINGADTQHKGVVKWANAMFEIWHDNESEYYGSDGGFVLAWVHSQDDCIEAIGNIYEPK